MPSPRVFLFRQRKEPRHLDVVNVSDCLKNFQRGIVLSVFNAVHVAGAAAHLVSDIFISQALLYTQLGYDGSKSLTGRVCLARQLT